MKRSSGYKLLFIGCLMVVGPFALAEFLGLNFSAFQTFADLVCCFGLMLIVTGIMIVYYRGKRKR